MNDGLKMSVLVATGSHVFKKVHDKSFQWRVEHIPMLTRSPGDTISHDHRDERSN
jgi:hypothetical protein